MIKKEYRLTERQVKKVLWKWKPFFSYNIVLNYLRNNEDYNRFSIVIWAKSVHTNVERNFFRRKFYALVENYIFLEDVSNEKKNTGFDMVFVVKKKTKLDKKNESLIKDFRNDINFLFNKVLNPWKKY